MNIIIEVIFVKQKKVECEIFKMKASNKKNIMHK